MHGDALTQLNTELNKSMVLMDNLDESHGGKTPSKRKSITISTKIQPPNGNNSSDSNNSGTGKRKSILKRKSPHKKTGDSSNGETRRNSKGPEDVQEREQRERLDSNLGSSNGTEASQPVETPNLGKSPLPRPRSLQELIDEGSLTVEESSSTFNLGDITNEDELWIMEIPRTIDPNELKGQTLILGEKSKLKLNGERYCAVKKEMVCNLTCVFHTGKEKKPFRVVNVKPEGLIGIRKKLSNLSSNEAITEEEDGVPFPSNLKTRHPLFGLTPDENIGTNPPVTRKRYHSEDSGQRSSSVNSSKRKHQQ